MMSTEVEKPKFHSKIPSFTGPFITSTDFQMSYLGSRRPALAAVVEHFTSLQQEGFGKFAELKRERLTVFYKVDPESVNSDMLRMMKCTLEEYKKSFLETPATDKEKFVLILLQCPFINDIVGEFEVVTEIKEKWRMEKENENLLSDKNLKRNKTD